MPDGAANAISLSSRQTGLPLMTAAAPPGGLSEYVIDALRRAIAEGDLAPGQELPETEIATQLGVSRGPVRAALTQLAREGLVELRRHHSARVVQLTVDDAEEVFTLRLALERLAAERAAERATAASIADMDEALENLSRLSRDSSPKEAANADLEFHDAVYRASEHERLQSAWATLRPQVYMFLLARNLGRSDFSEAAYDLHRTLRDVIAAGDGPGAQAAVDRHLRGAYARLLKILSQGSETV